MYVANRHTNAAGTLYTSSTYNSNLADLGEMSKEVHLIPHILPLLPQAHPSLFTLSYQKESDRLYKLYKVGLNVT